uniref:Minichromosome maintenance domain-containing protein 2 n=1 Tax=Eptatretus burgeri TaxID=7764 RepID=A0A8C4WT59_EPTBU
MAAWREKSGMAALRVRDARPLGAAFRFRLQLDPSSVTEHDAELGNLLLGQPEQARHLAHAVCFIAIKGLSLMESIQSENQLILALHLSNVPSLPGYTFHTNTFPRTRLPLRYLVVEVLVLCLTAVTKYTQSALYLCSNKDCPAVTGNYHLRVHVPGASETTVVRSDFSCSLCASTLKEDMKYRTLGDKQIIEATDPSALKVLSGTCTSAIPVRHQSLTVFLRDELVNGVQLGGTYTVVGVPATVGLGQDSSFCVEASNIIPFKSQGGGAVPVSMQKLHAQTWGSAWAFTGCLAQAFAGEIVPPRTMCTIKLALLLSLAGTGHEEQTKDFVDLLIIGRDTLVLDRLMVYAAGLSCRSIRHQACNEMFGVVSQDSHGTGTASIQAGSIVLARGGICFLGDMSLFKKDKILALQRMLESRTIALGIPRKFGEDVAQEISTPIQCAIWGIDHLSTVARKAISKEDNLIGLGESGTLPPSLIDAFGLVMQSDRDRERVDNDSTERVFIQHVLGKAVHLKEKLYTITGQLTTQDFQQLFQVVCTLPCTLSPTAETLIRAYYVASRRLRSTRHGILFPASAVRTLISLSCAHAKLSLRNTTLQEDALIAILLYEIAVSARHGSSLLLVPRTCIFPMVDGKSVSMGERDEVLTQKLEELQHFTSLCTPNLSQFNPEE